MALIVKKKIQKHKSTMSNDQARIYVSCGEGITLNVVATYLACRWDIDPPCDGGTLWIVSLCAWNQIVFSFAILGKSLRSQITGLEHSTKDIQTERTKWGYKMPTHAFSLFSFSDSCFIASHSLFHLFLSLMQFSLFLSLRPGLFCRSHNHTH